jgi:hypothetical protein
MRTVTVSKSLTRSGEGKGLTRAGDSGRLVSSSLPSPNHLVDCEERSSKETVCRGRLGVGRAVLEWVQRGASISTSGDWRRYVTTGLLC